MKRPSAGIFRRLMVAILTTIGGFFVTAIVASTMIPSRFWLEPILGPVTAIGTIAVASIAWPENRRWFVLGSLVVGGLLAYELLASAYYPENSDKAYEPTLIPLIATVMSGAIAAAIALQFPDRPADHSSADHSR